MSLRKQVLSGLFWTGGAKLASQVLTWAITLVVIRLLSPSDYGLLAMATIFGSFLSVLGNAGLGAALVQAQEIDEEKLRRVFGAVIVVNVGLFLLQYAAAPFIAAFFEEDKLIPVIRVLGLQFLISTFGLIPGVLLTRKLDFKRQSVVDLAAAICGSLASLGLALAGYGVWALVTGGLVSSALGTIAMNYVSPFLRWPDFSFKGLRGIITFGGQVTVSGLLWMVYSRADAFIAGKMLGKDLLGFYSVSMHLASLPVQKISSMLNTIAFSAFARTQEDAEAVSRFLMKAMRVLAFFSFPITWGISSVAPEIVSVFLGSKWQLAVLPLQLLPIVMPLTMMSPILNSAFHGLGRGEVVLRNVITAALVMPAAFLIGSHWGLLGLSLAWVFGFPLVLLANLLRMLPLVGLKLFDLLRAIALPALGAAGMCAMVAVVRYLAADALGTPLLMGLLIAVGALTYAAIAWFGNRTGVSEVADLLGLQRLAGMNKLRA